jgi:tetratricopeptide (TPR) repeat protein
MNPAPMRTWTSLLLVLLVAVGTSGCIFNGDQDVKYAWSAVEAREFDQAIRLATRAIRFGGLTSENLSSALECRATASMRRDQLGHALEDLDRIVSLRPDYAGGYFLRGDVRLRQKQYDTALADLNQGMKIADPKGASSNQFLGKRYAARGVAWLGKKDVEQALADLNQAIALDPRRAESYYFRSFAYQRKGMLPEALADMEVAVKLHDSNIFSMPSGEWLYRLEQLRGKVKR